MENHPDVEYIELTRVVRPLLNKSAPIIGADQMWKVPPGLEGTGIVIGIVDSGFDFYHPDFRDPVTDKTRIQWLWDQSVTAGGSAPVEYGYGAEYTRQQIDLDLNPGPPYSVVPHQAEVDAHGTLVAGVAAGNARADARYRGIAPKAELILVHTMPSNQLAFGSLKWVLEAIDYIFRRAGNTPCVVNLSLGDNLGPHDGTSLLEQKIDELLDGSTYRAVVIAAGNAQQAKKHCELSFTQGSHSTLWMQVPSGTRITEAIEIWYPHDALLDLTITLPGGAQAGPYQGGGQVILDVLSDVDIQVSPAAPDQRNGKNVIGLELRPKSNAPLPPGTWVFVLDEVSQTPWPTNALDLYASIDQNTNIIWTNNFSTRTLITPATCRLGITVGSHEKTQYGNVDADSSWGPTRDGRQKPEIIAPGVGIWTTKAGAQPGASAYIKKVGTSVAATTCTRRACWRWRRIQES
jgi:subtilisin family serine protease